MCATKPVNNTVRVAGTSRPCNRSHPQIAAHIGKRKCMGALAVKEAKKVSQGKRFLYDTANDAAVDRTDALT
ncbi:hypothetical protein GCM10027343_09410 [Noviherbaspirillum agri]